MKIANVSLTNDRRKAGKPRIGVVTYPGQSAAEYNHINFSIFFSRLLLPFCESVVAITADNFPQGDERVRLIKTPFKESGSHSFFARLGKYLGPQLSILPKLIKMARSCDIVLFFEIADTYALPALMVKGLFRKKIIVVHSGLTSRGLEVDYGKGRLKLGKAIPYAVRLLEKITFALADSIAIESESIAEQHDLTGFKRKIYAAKSCYVDIDAFKIAKDISARQNVVGYIGRFGEDKGAVNFARAATKVTSLNEKIRFLMVGGVDAEEISRMETIFKESNLLDKVTLVGHTAHETIPHYLNELKLLVLPSYSEGLPRIVLEAMACGTPVLATAVGGIPDVVKDAETGFILPNNTPETIAEGIIRALSHPSLPQIIQDARRLIEREYSYQPTLKRWGRVLSALR